MIWCRRAALPHSLTRKADTPYSEGGYSLADLPHSVRILLARLSGYYLLGSADITCCSTALGGGYWCVLPDQVFSLITGPGQMYRSDPGLCHAACQPSLQRGVRGVSPRRKKIPPYSEARRILLTRETAAPYSKVRAPLLAAWCLRHVVEREGAHPGPGWLIAWRAR